MRVLGVKQRIGAALQAQLAAQIVDGLRPLAAHKARQPPHGAAHAGNLLVGAREPGIHGQHRRIERREKRKWREHVAGPRNSRHLGHQRPGVIELAQQQQVGARGLGGRIQQVVVGLAQRREEKIAQAALGAFAHVVNHPDEDGVGGVDVRADRVKLQAQWNDLRLI